MKTSKVSITGIGQTVQASADDSAPSPANRWTAVKRVRLPHRPGMPLSCTGSGDTINDGGDVSREPNRG
ncbi:hypothetical protein SAMN05216359_1043 [Roseateles sp. YR242]|uniref:hypothetical protein n=1 Tax=Roseateles sp. YR242 TaxID=1855305 RepID=UPI0008C8058B|nr:hypothetical protein [Roseateles sp. YR242]SEK92628.1 hypothetical protein SAMN05216359_1043 [Roseateles sp. YR242]